MYEGMEAEILSYLKDHDERTSRQINMHLDDEYESMPRSTMQAHLMKLLNEQKIKRRLDDSQRAYWSVV
jgi:DNA-binding transcriptional ArsR family regulator